MNDPYELIGTAFGLVSVWLTIRRSVWCWPTGLVNVVCFFVMFLRVKLYAELITYAVFFVLGVYGWWTWAAGGTRPAFDRRSRSSTRRWPAGDSDAVARGRRRSRLTAMMRWRACFVAASAVVLALYGTQPRAQAPAAGPASPPGFEQLRKIDIHSHIYEDVPAVNAMLRRINLRVVNVSVPATDGHMAFMHRFNAAQVQRHPDLFSWASTFDLLTRYEPGYGERVAKALDETFAQGAVMVKIWKEVGLELKRPDGTFMLPDDPVLDPVYAHLALRRKPLLAHLAEPLEAWQPLDPKGVHYSYYSRNPQWHLYGKPGFPSHAQIIAARDHILEKHPTLVVIGAHIGSLEHDVDEVAKRLDRYPNFHVEVAARTRDLVRQPSSKVRAFFVKYQDRIMYGVDRSWAPHRTPNVTPTDAERQKFADDLEAQYRRDWAYYAGSGTITYNADRVEALALPKDVLDKFYWKNAGRIIGVK